MGIRERIAARMGRTPKPAPEHRQVVCAWADPVSPAGQLKIRLMDPVQAVNNSAVLMIETSGYDPLPW